LWGVRENDPLTFAAVVVSLLAVAVTASLVPALRVRKLDPVSLLRSE
jgi:ABC-type lipoprotein release transport system permease subunit